MKKPFEVITSFLDLHGVDYEVLDHEPVYTSEAAARIRGMSLRQGAKSLLLKADKEFVLVILSGDKKLDSKKLKKLLGIKKLRFANPEEVVEIMNCEVGSCYPFGNLIDIQMIVDMGMGKNNMISFNPGLHDKTILERLL